MLSSLKYPSPTRRARLLKSKRPSSKFNPGEVTIPIYLSLGSNWGRRQGYLRKAQVLLESKGIHIVEASSIYKTSPQGFRAQPSFLNQVVKVQTALPPEGVLRVVHEIERKMSRLRLFPNSPRTIDIDVLFYNNLVMDTANLTVPHPRLHERGFILVPLTEIAPAFRHPSSGLTVRKMLALVGTKGVRRWQ